MPKKKTTAAPAAPVKETGPSATALAAGVSFEGETKPPATGDTRNPGDDPGTAGLPLAGNALPSTTPLVAPKTLPFPEVVGIGIFGERERNRLVSIAAEIGSLQKRSAELLARIPGEVYRLLETVGEAAGGTASPELTADILSQIEGTPGETFADKLAAYAVRGRASLKMRTAQAEFESMRGLAGVGTVPAWTDQPRFGGEGDPQTETHDGGSVAGPGTILAPQPGEGLTDPEENDADDTDAGAR